MENLTYHAAIYVRLSKEDGDKEESDSIGNQKELISRFLASKPEICIEETFVDDGFSGADFLRPSFQKMLLKLKSGEINCVVVKDLSRFGRNFIETGRFLSTIFPALGVRFIAINDSIDSAGERSAADNQVIIPVRNLINDAYLRDISIKVRSQLEVKRRKGDFIGSFPMYGYLRDPDDRHKLIIDPVASETVLDIFHWKIEGMSQKGIADKLNAGGVLCPAEYKRFICGFRYSSGFQINSKALWSAVTVGRILRNESYIGSLVQGRRTTPNHKVKKVIEKPREDWAIVENHHPAIIDRDDFDVVTRLML
jgi:DNA invertase Pin-like site-specific DNA recombinase